MRKTTHNKFESNLFAFHHLAVDFMEMDLAHFVTDFVIVKSDEAKAWMGQKIIDL